MEGMYPNMYHMDMVDINVTEEEGIVETKLGD